MKKLYRSDENVIAGGVCGGIAEYYEVDPVIVRIAGILITILTGIFPMALVYLLSVIVIPKRSNMEQCEEVKTDESEGA